MTDQRFQEATIFALLDDAVARENCELAAVELTTDNGRRILRISVDRPGGVQVQDCRRVSHAISPILDVEDPLEGTYHLEVSSPGIDRPIQRPTDFDRFAGYTARVLLEAGGLDMTGIEVDDIADRGRRRFKGQLLGTVGDADSADGRRIRIAVDRKVFEFPIDLVERAHLALSLDEYQGLARGDAPPAIAPLGEMP